MNAIPVVGIPELNRFDLLQRCLDSLDHPVDRLVIVQNTLPAQPPAPRLKWPKAAKSHTVICHPNAGVAASWNEIIKLFPAPYWMLVNDDIQFTPGDLRKMAKAVKQHRVAACFYGNHGASWWAVTRWGVAAVGTFDENLFPAYLEDCDWSRRCDLAGARRFNVPNCHALHGDPEQPGSCTVNYSRALRAENSRTHANNFRYYTAKWGGLNGQEIYSQPFNDPGWPIWAWKFDPAFRAEQRWSLPGAAS